jgi:hypothetical protein
MTQWEISKYQFPGKATPFNTILDLNEGYRFGFSLSRENYHYDSATNSGIFVFGYFIKRLDGADGELSLKNLFERLSKNQDSLYHMIKGIFTIILLVKGKFLDIKRSAWLV